MIGRYWSNEKNDKNTIKLIKAMSDDLESWRSISELSKLIDVNSKGKIREKLTGLSKIKVLEESTKKINGKEVKAYKFTKRFERDIQVRIKNNDIDWNSLLRDLKEHI